MKTTFAALLTAVLCLGTGIGTAAPAHAATEPFAAVGLGQDSYTAAHADFAVALSSSTGLASYDVRRADSSMRARHRAPWRFPTNLQQIAVSGTDASPRLTFHIARGRVLCVSVRARDLDGTVGAWSDDTCALRAADDASLVHHGHTRVVRDDRYWGGRATELDRGARLALRRVPRGSRVLVVVTELDQNVLALNGRTLEFTVPGRNGVHHYSVGGRFGPTRYTQVIGAARPSARRGPVVFHGGHAGQHPRWSSPLEGIVIQPRWL